MDKNGIGNRDTVSKVVLARSFLLIRGHGLPFDKIFKIINPARCVCFEKGDRYIGNRKYEIDGVSWEINLSRRSFLRALPHVKELALLNKRGQLGNNTKISLNLILYGRGFYDSVSIPSDFLQVIGECGVDFEINIHADSTHNDDIHIEL